jgi:hypothetical protein
MTTNETLTTFLYTNTSSIKLMLELFVVLCFFLCALRLLTCGSALRPYATLNTSPAGTVSICGVLLVAWLRALFPLASCLLLLLFSLLFSLATTLSDPFLGDWELAGDIFFSMYTFQQHGALI